MIKKAFHLTYKMARRIVIAVVGFSVLAIGVVMIVTPGPAFVVIPVGLAILSIEFTWAKLWLARVRRTISEQAANSFGKRAENHRERVSDEPWRNKKTGAEAPKSSVDPGLPRHGAGSGAREQ